MDRGAASDIYTAVNALENAGYAVDSTVVHLAGSETISGAKTLTLPTLGNLTGLVKAASGALSTATAGTDYQAAIMATGILKGSGAARS